jgi:hypothetical protein
VHLALVLLKSRESLAHLLVRHTDKSIIRAAHGYQDLEAPDKKIMLLASTCSSMRRLGSCWRCSNMRRSRDCSWRTHSSSSGWRRRRNCRTLNDVRLISSMLAIIAKLHVWLIVDGPLNVWSIYGILSSMVENKHHFYPEKYADAWESLAIQYS